MRCGVLVRHHAAASGARGFGTCSAGERRGASHREAYRQKVEGDMKVDAPVDFAFAT